MPTLIDDAVTSLKMSTCKAVIKKFKTTEPEWKRTRLYDGVLVRKAKKKKLSKDHGWRFEDRKISGHQFSDYN